MEFQEVPGSPGSSREFLRVVGSPEVFSQGLTSFYPYHSA